MILISSQKVIELAFSVSDQIDAQSIKETKIDAAQETFLRPVLGKLFDALIKGKYEEFLHEYIWPALAYYVRYAMIPDLALKLNDRGVQVPFTNHSNAATDKQRSEMRTQAKSDADALLDKATRYLCSHLEEFPEYDPLRDIRKCSKIKGGTILNLR